MISLIEKNKPQILAICKKHYIKSLYVFGSAANDKDFNSNSDIDLLYDFDFEDINIDDIKTWKFDPFIEFFNLKEELENITGRPIDLVSYKSIKNKYFKAAVDQTKQLIYG